MAAQTKPLKNYELNGKSTRSKQKEKLVDKICVMLGNNKNKEPTIMQKKASKYF